MRIAYFGGDMFYPCMESLVKNGHEIISLFTVAPVDGEYDITQNVCRQVEALGSPIMRTKPTGDDIKELQRNGCEMILSAGYPYKIPSWDGGSIIYGVNIHPSFLPEGAGPMPLPMVIIKGLKKTGVTLHKLSQEWDAGDIILQESFPLFGKENMEELLCRSQNIALSLIEDFMRSPEKYWENATPQLQKEGDYWSLLTPQEQLVCYTDSLEDVSSHLRAHRLVSPDGNVEFVSNVSVWQQKHNFKPGTVLQQNKNIYLIATADGLVQFTLEVQHALKLYRNYPANKD